MSPFPAHEVQTLELKLPHANVRIRTSNAESIRVRLRVKSKNSKRAKAYFDAYQFNVAQDVDAIKVDAAPNPKALEKLETQSRSRPDIEVTIEMPPTVSAKAHIVTGDVEVDRLVAGADLRTRHGDIVAGTPD